MFTIQVIPAASDEWNSWVERAPHDFAHAAEYHSLAEARGEGRAFLAVFGGRDKFLAWPYLLRDIGECEGLAGCGLYDVTSVYGYPGPLAAGCQPEDSFLQRGWQELRELWRSQHVVSAFTRFHPLLANQRWLKTGPDDTLGVQAGGRTVSIDLEDPDGTRHYKRALRQHIQRGRSLGMTTTIDPDLKHLDEFVRIYTDTMHRNRASQGYFFSPEYFRQFKERLGPRVFLACCCIGSRVAAAAFVVEYGGVVNPHLAGTSPEFLAASPFKVLVDDLREWGRRRGNHSLHLGGGRGGVNDSLFRFKAEFSPRYHDFYTGRWILAEESYRWLCNERQRHLGAAMNTAGDTAYFPAYRAPVDPVQVGASASPVLVQS